MKYLIPGIMHPIEDYWHYVDEHKQLWCIRRYYSQTCPFVITLIETDYKPNE